MIGHFDGDLLVYRCGFACEDEPVEFALHTVRLTIEAAMANLGLNREDLRMYISGPTNFRDGVATIQGYKANRIDKPKPKHGDAIREYLRTVWDAKTSEDEEADDVVGYSHYAMYLEDPYSTIIISVDKDLDMIPGFHYNFVKDISYNVSEEEGIRWFYTQLLMGDPTDNIPGLPGIGKVKAGRALAELDNELDYYKVALAMYEEEYVESGLDALIENARLLWIRRNPDEWWNPPACTYKENDNGEGMDSEGRCASQGGSECASVLRDRDRTGSGTGEGNSRVPDEGEDIPDVATEDRGCASDSEPGHRD